MLSCAVWSVIYLLSCRLWVPWHPVWDWCDVDPAGEPVHLVYLQRGPGDLHGGGLLRPVWWTRPGPGPVLPCLSQWVRIHCSACYFHCLTFSIHISTFTIHCSTISIHCSTFNIPFQHAPYTFHHSPFTVQHFPCTVQHSTITVQQCPCTVQHLTFNMPF